MKKIIIILSILFFGCNQKDNDIEIIEIMNYGRDLDSNSDFVARPQSYKIIDGNGSAKSINHLRLNGENKFIKYRVDEKILNDISIKTLDLDDKYFRLKKEDFDDGIYCGLYTYIRVRIKYKNRKNITFVYLKEQLKTKKYYDFNKLNRSVGKKIETDDTINLIEFEKNFEKFTSKFKYDLLFPGKIYDVKPVDIIK